MSVSEKDLETVEVWLDGELPADQVDALRSRLSSDPALAETVARLRADREIRSQIWQAIEPGDKEIETLISDVRRGVKRDEIWTLRFRALRNISAVAASIVVIFAVGWISRDRLHLSPDQSAQPIVATENLAPKISPKNKIINNSQNIGLVDAIVNPDGSVRPSVSPSIPGGNPLNKLQPMYRVTVEDRFGHKLIRDIIQLSDLGKVSDEFTRAMLEAPANQQK